MSALVALSAVAVNAEITVLGKKFFNKDNLSYSGLNEDPHFYIQ